MNMASFVLLEISNEIQPKNIKSVLPKQITNGITKT